MEPDNSGGGGDLIFPEARASHGRLANAREIARRVMRNLAA